MLSKMDVGTGFGTWNTMHKRCRSARGSSVKMFSPSSKTMPSTRVWRTVSCRRLKTRSSVDLPEPDGPMMAVIWRSGTRRRMSKRTCRRSYQAFRPWTTIFAAESAPARVAGAGWMFWQHSGTFMASPACMEQSSCDQAGGDDGEQQDGGRRPGLAVPVVVRGDGVGVDGDGQRGRGLIPSRTPVTVIEGSKQQRCGLTGDPRRRHQPPADSVWHPATGCRTRPAQRGTGGGGAQSESRLAQRA